MFYSILIKALLLILAAVGGFLYARVAMSVFIYLDGIWMKFKSALKKDRKNGHSVKV